MGKDYKPLERLHLISLIAAPVDVAESQRSASDLVLATSRSRAPLRALLQKRSDFAFLDQIAEEIISQGFATQLAGPVVDALVNQPSLAVRQNSGDATAVLHGVAVRCGELGTVVILLRARVSGQLPPEAELQEIETFQVDCDDEGIVLEQEAEAVCARLEQLQRDLQLKRAMHRPADAPERWGILGAASHRVHDLPPDWQSRVESLGTVLGMETYFASTVETARAQALHERLDVAIVLDDGQDWSRFRELREAEGLDTLDVAAGSCFDDLIAGIRTSAVAYVREVLTPQRTGKTELRPGDTVYHRKISPQPRKYDRFSEPVKSCSHGDVVPWRSADKAVKGMQRIYSNFQPSMLHHCSRYPDCGVYVVIVPDARDGDHEAEG